MARPLRITLLVGLTVAAAFHAPLKHRVSRALCASREEEESALVQDLLASAACFKRYGVDPQDKSRWPAFATACTQLETRAPYIMADDINLPREIVGDWELIGTTSSALFAKKGVTGLGKVPFTNPHKHGLFFRYGAARPPAAAGGAAITNSGGDFDEGDPRPGWGGDARVAEILEVFGKPAAKNELRGEYRFASSFRLEQVYTEGDMGGQRNQRVASRAVLDTVWLGRSLDGAVYRVGRSNDSDGPAWYAFKQLNELDVFFAALNMPTDGGSSL